MKDAFAFTRAFAFVCLVVIMALLFNRIEWPKCSASSAPGPRIGGVLLIGGCK